MSGGRTRFMFEGLSSPVATPVALMECCTAEEERHGVARSQRCLPHCRERGAARERTPVARLHRAGGARVRIKRYSLIQDKSQYPRRVGD
jgi:hypothetical protein